MRVDAPPDLARSVMKSRGVEGGAEQFRLPRGWCYDCTARYSIR